MTQSPGKSRRARSSPMSPASFRRQWQKIEAQHAGGSGGYTTCLRLTRLVDAALQEAFDHHAPGSPLAVIAIGGYGRQELCFGSDVDTMVLTRGSTGVDAMTVFYHAILDYGLDVGHSFRTIEDCLALRETDIDAWIALLDARFICGDRQLFRDMVTRVKGQLSMGSIPELLRRVHTLSEQRHAKYGRSTKLLEPNIKNSSGGLRDAQTVLWMLRLTRSIPVGQRMDHPSLREMLDSPGVRALFPADFLRRSRKGMDMLFRIRHSMHLRARSLHDILEFSSQDPIAQSLRYRSAGSVSSVERFMRDYYDAASGVAELHSRVVDWTKDRWLRPRVRHRTESVSLNLRVKGSILSLAPGTGLTTRILLEAYHLRIERSLEFSFSLEDLIHRRRSKLTALRSRSDARSFFGLFRHEAGISEALRHMNRFGLLARWLPDWRPLVRFFQHNQYHYFTADEHTLTVLEKAEELRSDQTSFGEAFRSLDRKDVLFLSCLFHDITKPRRLDDHEVTGAELAETVLNRFGMHDIAGDVAFLVRHHLLMEQIAFRRNLGDPITISDFAGRFARPDLLRYLYVLTYADLSAVNKNVLTEWKKALLTELYGKTMPLLEKKEHAGLHTGDPGAEDLIRSLPQEDADTHASLLRDDAYRRTFSRREIADHIEALKDLDVAATIYQHWSDVTDLTLLTKDAPFVLARVCGAIYANDLSIIDARIFTREDGVVIDSFRIVDGQSHRPLTEDRCRSVSADIRDVLTGACSVDGLLERHRRRWKRRSVHVNPNVRVDVVFEDHPHFTIIDVFGADTAGFLYVVSDTISQLGCTIHFAKIATRGDGIVDAFYVQDSDGRAIATDERRQEIRGRLLGRITDMYDDSLPERQDPS